MSLLKKIILLLFSILSFSCQTPLEKQGWQRTAIVSQLDTSTINRYKEPVVQKIHDKSSYYYRVYISEKNSTGQIINGEYMLGYDFNSEIAYYKNSDIAYYKWESDSMCLVKLLNQGNVWASVKLGFTEARKSLYILDEPKKKKATQ